MAHSGSLIIVHGPVTTGVPALKEPKTKRGHLINFWYNNRGNDTATGRWGQKHLTLLRGFRRSFGGAQKRSLALEHLEEEYETPDWAVRG